MSTPDLMPQIEAALDKVEIACCNNYTTELRLRRTTRAKLEEAREVLLDLIRNALAQQPERGEHGYMPANLAHKLLAFAAEPEGTVNSKMIAWSLHRMLNAQPIASLLSAQDEAAVRAEWQPIETAPKDGRSVLLCWECGMYVGSWRLGHEYEPQPHRQAWRTVDGTWSEPTHWMPLPSPPGHLAALHGDKA